MLRSFIPSLKTSRPGLLWARYSLWATHQELGTGCPPGADLSGEDMQQPPGSRCGIEDPEGGRCELLDPSLWLCPLL